MPAVAGDFASIHLSIERRDPLQAQLTNLLQHYQNGRHGDVETLGTSITRQFPRSQLGWKVLGATLNQLGKFQQSLTPNQKAVELDPEDAEAHVILGSTLQELLRIKGAEKSYRKAIALKPDLAAAHYCLGTALQALGRLEDSEISYRRSIDLNPNFAEAHVNLGIVLRNLGRSDEGETSFRKAIGLAPHLAEAHFNLGITFQEFGRLDDAEACFRKAIALKPGYAEAHCGLGHVLSDLERLDDAKASYNSAVVAKPGYVDGLMGLARMARSVPEARNWVEQCLAADENHERARLINAALKFYEGDRADFDALMRTDLRRSALMRSFAWMFGLPKLPSLYFNRPAFFDAIITQSVDSRPFYEFGVWRGASFRYLIKAFRKGYGFDTFTGLPEDWHVGNGKYEKAGSYSNDGNIPAIEGGTFVAGKFDDTLPIFFSQPRPVASVINFDADLYSSTVCALNCAKSVIDSQTVLVFDEMIAHECWEQDEFKALNDFCAENGLAYEVIAASFFTKQAAVKLVGL